MIPNTDYSAKIQQAASCCSFLILSAPSPPAPDYIFSATTFDDGILSKDNSHNTRDSM